MRPMPDITADTAELKLTFLRDIVRASRDPEAESFPLMELAQSIINAAMTPAMVRERLGSVSNEGLPELSIAAVDSDIHPAKFDLALLIAESDQGLLSNWTYRTDLFRSETITELGRDFNKLLAKIPQHLDSPLSTLLNDERKEKYGKNLRLSNKAVHAN